MGYGAASGVAAYCRNLLGSQPTWTTSTCPTKHQVDSFLSSGCAVIETTLEGRGYTTPVASTVTAYGWLTRLEELWGAAHAEFHRTNLTLSPGERTRGQVFYEMFWDEMDRLLKTDLSQAGVTRSTTGGKIYVGGISRSEKQAIESNSDYMDPRFFRGVIRSPRTRQPTPSTASK
jgi:hypothetical protein